MVVLVFLGMSLEMLSLGLLIPAIALVTKPESNNTGPEILRILSDWLGGISLVFIGLALFVGVFLVKSVVVLVVTWLQRGYSMRIGVRLQSDVFRTYLARPYEFHLQNNSANLIRDIQNSSGVINGGIEPFLTLVTDGLIAIGLLGFLIYVQPLGSLLTVVMLGTGSIILYRMTKERIETWGKVSNDLTARSLQRLQEGFAGIKDVLILNRQAYFLGEFEKTTVLKGHIVRKYGLLQTLPRVWLEIISILSFAVLVAVLTYQGKTGTETITTLGLFVAIAFRVIPSANRVSASVQGARYNAPMILNTFNVLKRFPTPIQPDEPMNRSWSELRVENLEYSYPGTEVSVLQNISVTIQSGQFVGVVGESGSGKSTLIDLMMGLLPPRHGSICLDDANINEGLRSWQSQIGYVPQTIFLSDDTIMNNIAFGIPSQEIDEAQVLHALRLAQLTDFVSTQKAGLETQVGERGVRMSGGQRQRVGIARALYHDPRVLILDEATSALDSETEREVMHSIRLMKGSLTIIAIAHRTSSLGDCDFILRLQNGSLVNDLPKSNSTDGEMV